MDINSIRMQTQERGSYEQPLAIAIRAEVKAAHAGKKFVLSLNFFSVDIIEKGFVEFFFSSWLILFPIFHPFRLKFPPPPPRKKTFPHLDWFYTEAERGKYRVPGSPKLSPLPERSYLEP